MPTKEEVFEKVKDSLMEALGVDDDEVAPGATMVGDLGAESIDFLDIVFRLEKAFEIEIPRKELFPEDILTNAQFIEDGKVTRAWLGVHITTLREDDDYRDLAVGIEDGVVLRQFVSGGPAENSDLELADVITEVDGNSVKSADELKRELRLKKAGDSVTLGLMRNGKAREIEVETGAFPEEFTAVSRMRRSERKPEADTKAKLLGMTVQNINADLAKRFEVEGEKGVIVTAIENDSVAAEKGISPGDIVTRINSAPVDSVASFKAALEGEDLKKGVIVHLTSEGSQRFEVLKQYE